MKKLYTLIAVSCLSGAAIAQQVPQIEKARDYAAPQTLDQLGGFEAIPYAQGNKPNTPITTAKGITEEVIGESFYDLQTNSGVMERCIYHADGSVTGTFTFSNEANTSFTDRGTGYNYHDGNSWGALPGTRVEQVRTGWSTPLLMGSGKEVVISHSATGSWVMNERPTKGSGAWTESVVPSNTNTVLWWSRAAVGGTNDNTIHLIGMTTPTAAGGTVYNGLDGALLYWRSQDEGATWDRMDVQIPGLDTASGYRNFRADAFQIEAQGDDVVFAVFNQWHDVQLWRSADNGNSWNLTTVADFPLDGYVIDSGSDINNDGIADTIVTSDEAGALLMDHNGLAHLWWGEMRVLDADLTDGNTTFFPGTNGLRYWNENMPTDGAVLVAGAEDLNGSGALEFSASIPLYYTSLSSFPSAGINADGTIFVSYSAHMETFDNGNQNYRHVYLMKSNDGGATWHSHTDVTPDLNSDGLESVFASMAPIVDDKVRLIYQRDWEPGLIVRGDMDPTGINEIVYLCVDTLFGVVSVPELSSADLDLELYPNPAEGQTTLSYHLAGASDVTVRVMDLLGNEVLVQANNASQAGRQQMILDLSTFADGTYLVTLESDGNRVTRKLVLAR